MNLRKFSLSVLASSIVGTAMSCCYAQSPASAAKSDAAARGACNYACLIGFTNRYMDALVHKDPSRIPLAPDVRFTENDVEMPVGEEGIWGTISAVSANAMTVADTRTANAAWFGTVEEHGEPAYYAMRLRIRSGMITEVETVVERSEERRVGKEC